MNGPGVQIPAAAPLLSHTHTKFTSSILDPQEAQEEEATAPSRNNVRLTDASR